MKFATAWSGEYVGDKLIEGTDKLRPGVDQTYRAIGSGVLNGMDDQLCVTRLILEQQNFKPRRGADWA